MKRLLTYLYTRYVLMPELKAMEVDEQYIYICELSELVDDDILVGIDHFLDHVSEQAFYERDVIESLGNRVDH